MTTWISSRTAPKPQRSSIASPRIARCPPIIGPAIGAPCSPIAPGTRWRCYQYTDKYVIACLLLDLPDLQNGVSGLCKHASSAKEISRHRSTSRVRQWQATSILPILGWCTLPGRSSQIARCVGLQSSGARRPDGLSDIQGFCVRCSQAWSQTLSLSSSKTSAGSASAIAQPCASISRSSWSGPQPA